MTGFLCQVPALQQLYCPAFSSFLQAWPEAFQFLPHFLYTWGKIINSQLKAFKTMYTVCPFSRLSVWALTPIKSSQKKSCSEKLLDALTRKTFCCNNQLKTILALLLSICSLSIPGVTPQTRGSAECKPSTASPDKYPCATGHSWNQLLQIRSGNRAEKKPFSSIKAAFHQLKLSQLLKAKFQRVFFCQAVNSYWMSSTQYSKGLPNKEDLTSIDPILFQGLLVKSQITKLDSTNKSLPLCLHQTCQEIRANKASCLTGVSSTLEITAFK